MGASNVKAVYAQWGHLDDRPFRALVYMALVSMDGDAPPVYWEGREALASALGKLLVNPDDDSAEATELARATAFRAVERALQSLTVRGAVKVIVPAAPGRQAEYALNLSMERPTSSVGSEDDDSDLHRWNARRSASPTPDTERFNARRSASPTPDAGRRPEEQRRSTRNNSGENLRTAVTVPRPRPAEDPNFSGDGPSRRITLRVLPGTGPPSPHVVTQPALWPAVVPEEADVDPAQARQLARTAISDARLRQRARLARSAAQRGPGPVAEAIGQPARTPGPQCSACGTELDPDFTCFTCRDGKVQAG